MEDPIVIVTERTREHLLTVQEFASVARLHPKSVYRLIQAGRLPGVVRVGGEIRINRALAMAPSVQTVEQGRKK